MSTPDGARALLLTGTVGAGKTSVADALGDLLTRGAVPHAILDVDWLRRSWPSPPDDPFNSAMALRNLRTVAANYLQAGALRLVLAGVLESRAERDAYQATLGVPLAVCRLRVALPTIRQRLLRRHEHDAAGLRWHLARSGELHDILERVRIEDVVVDGEPGSVHQVARTVMAAAGW
ncbi:adenylyl-sulfate kinase [Actinoplanes sp. NPDC049599]|uniref:adenylyl-sulfate kinase n=1 Tax=Actinoplanes sp. NPDC049599 TaxID=3363903 RepID=UPI0037A727CE